MCKKLWDYGEKRFGFIYGSNEKKYKRGKYNIWPKKVKKVKLTGFFFFKNFIKTTFGIFNYYFLFFFFFVWTKW